MSISVDPADLETATDPYGPTAFVVVSGSSGPRITHVRPAFVDGVVVFELGSRSGAAAKRTGTLTVLWPACEAEPMSLIADCAVVAVDESETGAKVAARPVQAVRHRAAPN